MKEIKRIQSRSGD